MSFGAPAFWRRWAPRLGVTVVDQGIVAGTHFGLQLALGRWLAPSLYGVFALAHAILLFLMGVHSALLAEPMSVLGPAHHGKSLPTYLRSTWRLQTRFGAVAACGVAGLAGVIQLWSVDLAWALAGLVPATPAFLGFVLLRRACYVVGRPRTALEASVVYALTVGPGLLLLLRLDRLSPGFVFGLIAVGGALAAAWAFRRLGLSRAPAEWSPAALWREDWNYGRWMLGASLAHWGGYGVYVFFVGILVGLAETGVFRALQNLVGPVQQLLTAVGLLMLPWLAGRRKSFGSSGLGGRDLIRLWGPVVAFVALYALGLATWGREIVRLLYGQPRYTEAAGLLAVFALFALLIALVHGLTLSLRAEERTEPVFWSKLAATCVALLAGLGMTYRWGLPGAVWGLVLSVLAECAVLVKTFSSRRSL